MADEPQNTGGLHPDVQFEPSALPFHAHNGVDSYPLVQKLSAGTAILISPANGLGTVTISNIGVTSLSAGTNITLSPSGGTGVVTISATGLSYGNGSDGATTISGATTLTRDMFYTTLTVNSGVTLKTASYRIFANSSITLNGTISNDGGNGSNGTNASGQTPGTGGAGGSGFTSGTMKGLNGNTGANGAAIRGTGSSPSPANEANDVLNNSGAVGGGKFPATIGGGVASQVSIVASAFLASTLYGGGGAFGCNPQSSGGRGGDGGTVCNDANTGAGGSGGGSGAAGGFVFLASPTVTVSSTGVLSSKGGNGGNGGNGAGSNCAGGGSGDGGGGGGGGNGGLIIVISPNYTNSGTITMLGGTGGTGGTGGIGTGGASNGANGSNGGTGATGQLISLTS